MAIFISLYLVVRQTLSSYDLVLALKKISITTPYHLRCSRTINFVLAFQKSCLLVSLLLGQWLSIGVLHAKYSRKHFHL